MRVRRLYPSSLLDCVPLLGATLLMTACSKQEDPVELGKSLDGLQEPLTVDQLLVEFDSLPQRLGLEPSLKPDGEIVEILTSLHILRQVSDGEYDDTQGPDWAHAGTLAGKVTDSAEYSELRKRFIARALVEAPLWGWDSKSTDSQDFPFEKFDSCWRLFAPDDPVWFGMARLLRDIILHGSPFTAGFAGFLADHLLAIESMPTSSLMPLLSIDERWPLIVIARSSWESLSGNYEIRITDEAQLRSTREAFTRIVVLCNLPENHSAVTPNFWASVRQSSKIKRPGDSDFPLFNASMLTAFEAVHDALRKRAKVPGKGPDEGLSEK